MKRPGIFFTAVAGLACIIACGCELTNSADMAIDVSPASPLITEAGETVLFTASAASTNIELQLPLVWTLNNPSLGTILKSEGLTAVYESRGGIGNNVVTVQDQGDSEGVAVVNQR